ncbi:hypothetical protein PGT21_035200 [Puccinia graminis f. sp. tritici]|uniref:Glycoside hydrolase 131 catalytic N-terminal domain-containing protein n=1 Tax=Puccinia graminis f. sp. tritici TaxID=56615 RepID=A0A5B0P2H3_PUCGR|nr:hypothetical protein PGT21_035200 [Puccinia graminis f. sp. tritici]
MQQALLMAIFLFASVSLAVGPLSGMGSVVEERNANTNSGAAGGAPKRIFDFTLTPNMKTADLDNPQSALSKLIAYIVKGAAKASAYVSILHPSNAASQIQLAIRDDSIFIPGGNPANAQHGFRRTDVNPAIDKATTLTGITTWYQTIRLDSKAPLVLTHGYLFASIEVPVSTHSGSPLLDTR